MIGNYLEEAVKKAIGDRFCENEMRRHISIWNDWYCGKDDDFHTVSVNNGVEVVKRPMYKLRMAKKVAEDWADLLFNEKTYITTNDPTATEFLQGKDGYGGVFGKNIFLRSSALTFESMTVPVLITPERRRSLSKTISAPVRDAERLLQASTVWMIASSISEFASFSEWNKKPLLPTLSNALRSSG